MKRGFANQMEENEDTPQEDRKEKRGNKKRALEKTIRNIRIPNKLLLYY